MPDPYDKQDWCFINQLCLKLNGQEPAQYKYDMTVHDVDALYAELQRSQGMSGSSGTNSISYNEFIRNSFVASWNLSTCVQTSVELVMPQVPRCDGLYVKVEFSCPTPVELSMITWKQVATRFTVDGARAVGQNYYSKYQD